MKCKTVKKKMCNYVDSNRVWSSECGRHCIIRIIKGSLRVSLLLSFEFFTRRPETGIREAFWTSTHHWEIAASPVITSPGHWEWHQQCDPTTTFLASHFHLKCSSTSVFLATNKTYKTRIVLTFMTVFWLLSSDRICRHFKILTQQTDFTTMVNTFGCWYLRVKPTSLIHIL